MSEKLCTLRTKGGGADPNKYRFVQVYISGMLSTGSNVQRGYDISNAEDGDTLSRNDFIPENSEWLTFASDSSKITVSAKKALKAMVIRGFDTATYNFKQYALNETIVTIPRNVTADTFVGVVAP